MRFAIGAFAVAFGYVLIYYAAGLLHEYEPNNPDHSSSTAPISALLGLKTDGTPSNPPFIFKATSASQGPPT